MSKRAPNISVQLIGILLAALVPLLIVQAVIYLDRYRMALDAHLATNEALAEYVSVNLDEWAHDLLGHHQSVILAAFGAAGEVEDVNEVLGLLAEGHTSARSFAWVAQDGRVVASSQPARVGKVLEVLPWARPSGQISALAVGNAEGTVWLASAFPDTFRGGGYLLAEVDGSLVERELFGAASRAAEFTVIDGRGRILFGAAEAHLRAFLQSRPDPAVILKGLERPAGRVNTLGGEFIAAVRPVPELGWFVLATRPLADVRKEAFAGLRPHALAFFGVAALGALAAAILARGISRRLARLRASADALGQGRFETRVLPEGPAELQQLAAAFNAMAQQIVTIQRQRDDLLHAVSHDLRTPLTSVGLQAHLLRRSRIAAGAPEAELRSAEAILISVRRMDTMIGDLVDYARFEAGQLRTSPVEVNLGAFLQDLLGRFKGVLDTERIVLETAAPAPPALADPDRLERIVVNVLGNALKYGTEGTPVRVALQATETEVIVAVADEGEGIPKAEQAQLFERFRRGSSAGQRGAGLGLGLFISRTLTEAQGGRIWVESESGRGSTFYLALPRAGVPLEH